MCYRLSGIATNQKSPQLKNMSDPLLRQWCMLRAIPRQPRRIDAKTLLNKVAASGFETTLRTIQRDLVYLSTQLPLISDEAKPQGWSWRADAPQLDLPTLEPLTALVFHLAEKHLRSLLPSTTLNFLNPWFNTANAVLDNQGNGLAEWRNKVRVLASGQPQIPPLVNSEIQNNVSQALLQNKQLQISYTPRLGEQTKDYVVNLLGLVVRNQSIYLVGTIGDYTDIRQLALHRIQAAQLTDAEISRPEGFDLDQYIQQGAFGWQLGRGNPLRLVAKFSKAAALSITERLLEENQQTTENADGSITLTASVADTRELRVWLLGFGDQAETLEPATLRDEMASIALAMQRRYHA